MNETEKMARAMLAAELKEHWPAYARAVVEAPTLNGMPSYISAGVRAVIAALTPPDGYVLVPAAEMLSARRSDRVTGHVQTVMIDARHVQP